LLLPHTNLQFLSPKEAPLRKPVSLAGGLTPERARHAPVTAEIVSFPAGAAQKRHRVRLPLTSFPARMRILEEARDMPEAVRLRSLRRSLTPLDRALTDEEALSLSRLAEVETMLDSTSRTSPLARLGMGSTGRGAQGGWLPFSEQRRRETSGRAFVLARLSAQHRATATEFLIQMLPWRSEAVVCGDECTGSRRQIAARKQVAIERICSTAAEIARIYRIYDSCE
jgi:hypothetical protein